MDLDTVQKTCNRYHERAFYWLMSDMFGVSEHRDKRLEVDENRENRIREFCNSLSHETLAKFILSVLCLSPGRFGETFFKNRPEFATHHGSLNEPWRFHPDQWQAIEYDGDLLIPGGAGSGKTRGFACLGMFVAAFRKASVLIVAHSDTAVTQIFGEMVYQIERSSFLSGLFPQHLISRGNSKEIRCSNTSYGSIRFCITGATAHTIYGIQIGNGGYLLCDEAALYREAVWEAIFSRAREGCRIVLGSVPYGSKGNRFLKLVRSGVDINTMKLRRERVVGDRIRKEEDVDFAVVKFNKEKQPGWNEAQKRFAVRHYGSRDGYKYQTWVCGTVVDTENQVFSTALIDAVFVKIPLYRVLRVVWDQKKEEVRCSVHVAVGNEMTELLTDTYALNEFNLFHWVIENISSMPVDVGGIDAGKLQDEHVLLAFEATEVGLRLRWCLITMYVSYLFQADLIANLLRHKERNLFNLGIGIESTGLNIASMIWEALVHVHKLPESWVSTYSWASKVDVVTDKDKVERDQNRHKVTRSLKLHLTMKMIAMMSNQGRGIPGSFELPDCDTALRTEFEEHSSEESHHDVKFDKENDHRVEASRVALGRLLEIKGSRELYHASIASREMITTPREDRGVVV